MKLYPFYVQTMLSNSVLCIHSKLWYAITKKEKEREREDENKKQIQTKIEWNTKKKKCSRNEAISSKDRQWRKPNAMLHWALFYLYSAFLHWTCIACLPFSFAFFTAEKKMEIKHKRIWLLIAASLLLHFALGFIEILLGYANCWNRQNDKQISQYNFNKVNASIFKSQCSIESSKCVRCNCSGWEYR